MVVLVEELALETDVTLILLSTESLYLTREEQEIHCHQQNSRSSMLSLSLPHPLFCAVHQKEPIFPIFHFCAITAKTKLFKVAQHYNRNVVKYNKLEVYQAQFSV